MSASDLKQKELLLSEELKEKIYMSYWPTSYTFLHNHVVDALRRGGKDVFKAEKLYKQGKKVQKESEKFLNPELVLETYLDRIEKFKTGIEEVNRDPIGKEIINRSDWLQSSHNLNQEHYYDAKYNKNKVRERKRKLASMVKVEECEFEPAFGTINKGIKYSWNHYELALFELGEFEKELKEAYNSTTNKIKQIQNMWQVIDKFDDSANKELLNNMLQYTFI